MKLKWMKTQDVREGDEFEENYAFLSAGSHDFEALLEHVNIKGVFTGAFVLIYDGDYAEVWLTEDSHYYRIHAIYQRWELKRIPNWYHGTRGNNQYVVDAWGLNLPAKSHNGHFHTDGYDLYSYTMKIGRTRNGQKQLLLAWGFSAATTSHVNAVRGTAARHIAPIKVADSRSVVVGFVHPYMRDFWYYFPDEAPIVACTASEAAALVGKQAMLRTNAWGATSEEIGSTLHTWTPRTQIPAWTLVTVIAIRPQPFATALYGTQNAAHRLWEVQAEVETPEGREQRWFLYQQLAFGEFPVRK